MGDLVAVDERRVRVRRQMLGRRVSKPRGRLHRDDALHVPERRPTVAEVVRREDGDACGFARPRDRGPEPVDAEVGEDWPSRLLYDGSRRAYAVQVTVLARPYNSSRLYLTAWTLIQFALHRSRRASRSAAALRRR